MSENIDYVILWYRNGLDYSIRVEDVELGNCVLKEKFHNKLTFEKALAQYKKEFKNNMVAEMRL